MPIEQSTTEDLKQAAQRALEALEGSNLYTAGPWPIDVRPLAVPMTVIYYAADGKSYERTITPTMEGDSLNVALGERKEVEARTLWVPVQGDVAPAFAFSAGKSTSWTGLIFRAGDYPDKGCSFAEGDLQQFVDNFPVEGVPVMSEHEDSLLGRAMDRHGARLVKIWRVGGELHGEIKSPSWLDEALDGMRKSVSVGIDFAAKTLREISLTFAPRVADAAVFHRRAVVAFSHSTQFQDFAAKHPREAAQIVTEAASAPTPAREDMDKPTLRQRLTAIFAGKTPEQRAALTDDQIAEALFANEPNQPAPTNDHDVALRARVERVEAKSDKTAEEFAAERQERQDANDGLAFYCDQVEAGKVAPADKAKVLKEFSRCRIVDRTKAKTNFSANADGSEERDLREEYKAKPVLFRIGDPLLDSNRQPQFSADGGLGIFAGNGHFKEDK